MRVRARGLRSNRGGCGRGACMDREQNRTRRDGLLYLCHVPLLACIYMVYTWAVAIQYMSFVRAVMSVYIILKCKYAYRKRSPSNVFPLLCGCYVSPRPLSLSINSGWCLVMTEMLKVWSIGRKSAGKVDQVPPRAPCTEEHAVTVFRYYSEGGA